MEEKKIVITEKGMLVDGVDAVEGLSFLVGSVCQFFNDEFGKINMEKTGRHICDALFDARRECFVQTQMNNMERSKDE